MVLWVLLVPLVLPERMVLPAQLALLVLRDPLVIQVVLPAHKVPLALPALLVLKVLLEHKVQLALPVPLV
jgi:hypothetical protein